jgi:hypothetical protein
MTEDRPDLTPGACARAARQAIFRSTGTTTWLAILMVGLMLQGCGPGQGTIGSRERVYAADLSGAAKVCKVPKITPAGRQTTQAPMGVVNDGGWCGLSINQPGPKPFAAGLLTARPDHGNVLIHEVGDDTRIDYTPDRGFAGSDSFAVQLIPGNAVVKVEVIVTPPGGTPKA